MKLIVKAQMLLETLKNECGQDSVEYAVMIGILALGAIASAKTISTYVGGVFTSYAASL